MVSRFLFALLVPFAAAKSTMCGNRYALKSTGKPANWGMIGHLATCRQECALDPLCHAITYEEIQHVWCFGCKDLATRDEKAWNLVWQWEKKQISPAVPAKSKMCGSRYALKSTGKPANWGKEGYLATCQRECSFDPLCHAITYEKIQNVWCFGCKDLATRHEMAWNLMWQWQEVKSVTPPVIRCTNDEKLETSPRRCVKLFDFGCRTNKNPVAMRKEFHDLHPKEQSLYLEAIQALMNHNNGQTWLSIARLHGDFFYKGIHHGSSFLPWHRAYLLDAENAMRSLSARYACVTIATWDPARAEEVRQQPGQRDFNDVNGILRRTGALQHPDFSPRKTNYDDLKNQFSFASGAYYAFGMGDSFRQVSDRGLESSALHNNPHIFSRPSMGSRLSPIDPLFLSHHGHVDKVWWMWQQCKQNRVSAFEQFTGRWSSVHPGEDDVMVSSWVGAQKKDWTPRDLLHAEANGFTYHVNDWDKSKESQLHAASHFECDSNGKFLRSGGGRRLVGVSNGTQVSCNHLRSFADAITDTVCGRGRAFGSSATTITIKHGSNNTASLRQCCVDGPARAITPQDKHATKIVAGIATGKTAEEAIQHTNDLVCLELNPTGRAAVSPVEIWQKAKFMFVAGADAVQEFAKASDAGQEFAKAFNAGDFAAPCVTETAICDAKCVASITSSIVSVFPCIGPICAAASTSLSGLLFVFLSFTIFMS